MRLNTLKLLLNNNPNNKNNLSFNKLLLKNLLLEINKDRLNKNYINNLDINKYINELNNKGNKLQHLNNINNWRTQIYNYNKLEEINIIIKDNLVIKLLYKMLSYKIIISKPSFQHNTNKLNIKFYYYYNNEINNINNYYMDILSKYINLLNKNYINNLCNILSNYYNKEVMIEMIKLNYNYMNSDIFSKSIIKSNKINSKIEFTRKLNNNLPKLNDQLISMLYINNIKNINKIKYNNIINTLNNNNNNLNIKNIYNNFDINNLPMNILMFKYLTGWYININGRLSNSNSRTITNNILQGTFNNKKYLWSNLNNTYKLNYISANHNISNISNINKNGKYNIKVKLNYI